MFTSGVVPILNYGCGIWGYAKANDSDQIQHRAIRYFLGVNKFTPIPALQGEMGWIPSRVRKQVCMIRFWNRMIDKSHDRLTKRVFEIDYTKDNGWCAEVKKFFESIKMLDTFTHKEICDVPFVELMED